jgi:hypothetical protein
MSNTPNEEVMLNILEMSAKCVRSCLRVCVCTYISLNSFTISKYKISCHCKNSTVQAMYV